MMRSYEADEFKRKMTYELLKKLFPPYKLNTIEEYVDLFLQYYGVKYEKFLENFCFLVTRQGFRVTSCQMREIIWDRLLNENYKNFKLKGSNEIDKMTGLEFEVFLARFFRDCGYLVTKTPRSHDKGTDLIIQLYGRKAVVQAKRHKQTIGISAIQEAAHTAKDYHSANKALVIISSKFSKSAIECAERVNVELWDRERLMQNLKMSNFLF